MDIKQYIESGILESYVLGGASSQEMREVECLSSIYPEIKTALLSIQEGMERYIESIAVAPPSELKIDLMNKIKTTKQDITSTSSHLRVVNDTTEKSKPSLPSFYKWSIAASILMIVGLFAYQVKLNQDITNSQQELAQLKEKKDSESAHLIDSLTQIKKREELLASNTTQSIVLSGTEVSPESQVRIFWNKQSSNIVIAKDNLPSPTTESQYQLWGLTDGTPVSLGTLNKSELISEVREINLDKVDAFAITLEKNGGSKTPNLEQLYVIGNT